MRKTRRKLLKFLLLISGIVLLTIVVIILILERQSATLDQKIAEFEAKRKIPDSENAAVIYERLFADVNFTSVFEDDIYKQMSTKEFYKVYRKPWKSEDYPETAEWIQNRQDFLNELLKATKFEKCYFPLPTSTNEFSLNTYRFGQFRNCALLMFYAAENDIAEGRTNDAIEKYQFILKISEHIYQQPLLIDYLSGNAVESLALSGIKECILETEINEEQLKVIEKIPVQINDTWKRQLPQILEGEHLYSLKMENYPLLLRLEMIFSKMWTQKNTLTKIHNLYIRLLTNRRANRIVIGLRRFKNQNGQWPESLEQIKSLVDPNVLVDPWNNGSFVYKLTDDGFTLYSKGPNNIDEGGKYNTDKQGKILTDDWIIWPSN